ncbi:MAG TPA: hypothetical protein VN428_24230 [Bryobacteraceae bacterium]|nr:hypothetical protein [Bryobacteraceae bacterium]
MKLSFAYIASKIRLLLCLVALAVWGGLAVAQTSPDAAATPIPVDCGDRIEVPGQYVLMSDLTCWSSPWEVPGIAIEIIASNVDFDLQGFTLRGNIEVSNVTKVSVKNGSVESQNGTAMTFQNVTRCRIEGITLQTMPWTGGLYIQGDGNLIKRNFISAAWALAVYGSSNSVVQNSIQGMRVPFVAAGSDTVIAGNDIHGGGLSMTAVQLSGTGMILEDSRIEASSIGIRVSGRGNIVRSSEVVAWLGISVNGEQHLIEGNSVSPEMYGIHVSGIDNDIRRNTVYGAATFDLSGTPTTCTDNKWQNNTFTTADPSCIR